MVFEVEVDCTSSCTLTQHGSILTKALTKRGISEESLIKFLPINCSNFSRILDENVSNKVMTSTGFGFNSMHFLGTKLSAHLQLKFKA